MKYFYSLFIMLCSTLVIGLTGCKDPIPTPDPTGPLSAELTLGTIGINTIEMKLKTNKVTKYAYQISTDTTLTAPTAATLFGTGIQGVPADGENSIIIKKLEGNTDYKIFMATRSADGFMEEVFTKTARTKPYTELMTFVDADFFGITFHIEVPTGKTIGYAVADRDTYLGMLTYGTIDPSYMTNHKGAVSVLTESATVTFEGWSETDEEGNVVGKLGVLPGQALMLMCGEVVEGEPDYSDRETWAALYDWEKFYDNGGGGMDPLRTTTRQGDVIDAARIDSCWTTPYHKTMHIFCKPTDKMPNTHVNVNVTEHTTRTIKMTLTPDEALLGYGAEYMDVPTWDNIVETLGSEDAALTWFTMNSFKFETEPTEVVIEDLIPAVQYRMVMCGVGNESRTMQSVDYFDFTAKTATKPAPKIIVKGIKAPAGETESPWKVWFNVKSPTKDVKTANYACNSTGDFVKLVNSGTSYFRIVDEMGNPLIQDNVDQINSDAGLNLVFDSWEDSQSRLAVLGYNDEMTSNPIDTDKDGYADNTTIIQPDAPRVESSLFADLLGDWTATAVLFDAKGAIDKNKKVFKVTISAEPVHPTTCPEEVYALYSELSRAQVDELFAKFVVSADKYKGKVRGQNRLLCEGLNIWNDFQTSYQSPWNLFMSSTYSSYSTDDCFFDFGPKWYLQIATGDVVSIPVDLATMAPALSWGQNVLYLVGANATQYAADLKQFPVKMSADKLSFDIDSVQHPSGVFYPSLATVSQQGATPRARCQSIKLTKGWAASSALKSGHGTSLDGSILRGTSPIKLTPTHHKTRMYKLAPLPVYKKVVMKQVSLKDRDVKMDKLAEQKRSKR